MNLTIFQVIVVISVFLWSPSKGVEGGLNTAASGTITKELIDQAKVICAGEATAITLVASDTEIVVTQAARGQWQIAEFTIDHLLKGDGVPATIHVEFFLPSEPMRGMYFTSIPVGKRVLLLLNPVEGRERTYNLSSRTGSLIFLAPFSPEVLADRSSPLEEHLKHELLQAIKAEEDGISLPALQSLIPLGLTSTDVIQTLSLVSEQRNISVFSKATAIRIKLGDRTALLAAKKFVESGSATENQRLEIGTALRELTDSKWINDLAIILRSKDVFLRRGASYAMRQIDSDAVIPMLILALEDSDGEVQYNGIMGLTRLMSKSGDWAPAFSVFLEDKTKYIRKWQDWWESEGRK